MNASTERTEIHADGTVDLRIVREFAFSPEKVFEAWLRPEQLARWMGPTDEVNVTDIQVDASEGGRYRMTFNEPDGSKNVLNGVYKTIARYTQLVFTWIWEAPTDGAEEETLVSLYFAATAEGTRMTLLHQRFSSQELADRHHWGWTETFNKLERRGAALFAERGENS